MVIGAGLSVASGGTLTPMMAAMMTGGGYGLATGSLQKGLMAGLGAYGGAGLAGSLMGAGTGALSSAAGAAGASSAVPVAATEGLAGAASQGVQVGAPIVDAANLSQTGTNLFGNQPYLGPGQGAEAMNFANPVNPVNAASMVPTATPTPPVTPYPTALSQNAADIGNTYAQEQAAQNAVSNRLATATPMDTAKAGFGELAKDPSKFMTKQNMKYGIYAGLPTLIQDPEKQAEREKEYPEYYSFDAGRLAERSPSGNYFNPTLTRIPRQAAGGGLMSFDEGGSVKAVRPVEQDPYYAMSGQSGDAFKYLMGQGANPMTAVRAAKATPPPVATPAPITVPAQPNSGGLGDAAKTNVTPAMFAFDPITGQLRNMGPRPDLKVPDAPVVDTTTPIDYGGANGGLASLAAGGQTGYNLGDYSDGGRLLRGPGDGVSDSIPASIGDKRPARLADGEFVVPARIVSELGNGSTEAGARKLYAMMDRVQKARSKTTGKNRVAVNSRSEKMLPA
jgi:hypothetical protein